MNMDKIDVLANSVLGNKLQVKDGIGTQVRCIRTYLNYTQKELAQFLCVDRMTIVSIEKTTNDSEISSDVLFRLYYFGRNLLDSDIDGFLNELCKKMLNAIDAEITRKIFAKAEKDKQKKVVSKASNGSLASKNKPAGVAACVRRKPKSIGKKINTVK